MTRKEQVHAILQPSLSDHLPKETNYVLDYIYGSPKPHAVTDAGDKYYSYDPAGNMTGWTHKQNGTRRVITWNEENRVKQIEDNGDTTYYLYNDAGERVVKTSHHHGETIYVNRFYSIRNGELGTKHVFAGETRVLSKLVKTPKTVTDNTTDTTKNNLPIEKDQFYYHGDHLGSSNMITDREGSIYQHLEYFPYGETWIEEGGSYGGNTPGYKFTGKELDPETGLYYFGARYYDPVLSKWISADPILWDYIPAGTEDIKELLGRGGVYNPINLGLYRYAANNPARVVDPDGKTDYYYENGQLLAHIQDNKKDVFIYRPQYNPEEGYAFTKLSEEQSKIFAEFTGTIYMESSGDLKESRAMADVVNNRAQASGQSIESILRKTGIYGNKSAQRLGERARTESIMKNARAGVIDVFLGGPDDSQGAYFWEGLSFFKKETNYFHKRMEKKPPVFEEVIRYGQDISKDKGTIFMKYNNENPKYRKSVWP